MDEITVCMTSMERIPMKKKSILAAISDTTQNEKIVGFACKDKSLEDELTKLLERTAEKLYGQ